MTTKILVLASNPHGTEQLCLDREMRCIDDVLESSQNKEQFSLKLKLAVRIDDLQKSLLKEKPNIVHFCGHGTGSQGLVLETESGQTQLVNTQAIGDLFKLCANQIKGVVLNACYSQVQASVIKQHINYVVGTKKPIRDDAAIAFTRGFYLALFNGESIDRAYKFGCNRIQLEIYNNENSERKLVPVYSGKEGTSIDLPENEVLVLLTKEPINKLSSSTTTPNNSANPFSPLGGKISDPSLVFGRKKEISNIFEILNSGGGVALIGDSGVGKSSILQVINESATRELYQPRQPVYLNLGKYPHDDDFYAVLCRELKIGFDDSDPLKIRKFDRAIEKYKLLLILDQIEAMEYNNNILTNPVRLHIRALADGDNSPFRLVVAAKKPLNVLFPDSSDKVSPFENVCQELEINPWDSFTIREFIKARLSDNPINFTELDINQIITESKGHPQTVMNLCNRTYARYRQ